MAQVQRKPNIAIFELIPATPTGANFVREDTINTANPIRIIHPKNRVIMNTSIIKKEVTGEDGGVVVAHVPIRYMHNQMAILQSEQETAKLIPNPKTDQIIFINGFITVAEEGGFIGLYRFLKTHGQNISNPDRITTLKPVFREVTPVKDAEDINLKEFRETEAKKYLQQFVTEKNGAFTYDEVRIAALAKEFNVFAETPAQQVSALIMLAKTDPVGFLAKAKNTEQTVTIEINHALKLRLITFEGNTVIYPGETAADQPVKIKGLQGNFGNDEGDRKKIDALATWFAKQEGNEAYELFKAKLSEAKEKVA